MSMTTTIVENYILEPGNCTRYELIYFEYKNHYCEKQMCSITWLNRTRGGYTFVWERGEKIFASYALGKVNMNRADLGPILSDVKERYPGSIADLIGFSVDNKLKQTG